MMKKWILLLLTALVLSGCGEANKLEAGPKEVAQAFWDAAKARQLDTAKQYVTWESAEYLSYIADERSTIASVEFEAIEQRENLTTVNTIVVLERKDKDNVRLPTKTVLVKTEGKWRVELKQTLASILERSANKIANQLNQMFQQGLNELDKALAESAKELSGSLQQGAKELGQALEKNADQFGKSIEEIGKELQKQDGQQRP